MTVCPVCGLPTEEVQRWTEDGLGERVLIRCPRWHWVSVGAEELAEMR